MSAHRSHENRPGESAAHTRTRLIHGRGRSGKWDYDHHVVPPISSSATFRLDSAARGARGFEQFAHGDTPPGEHPIYIYDRLDEPTRAMLEENLAYAERGDFALCFASGMAAISAALATLMRAGDNLVAHKVLYGCTYSLLTNWLPRLDMQARLVDLTDPASIAQTADRRTRVVYFETPVNPDMTLIDIAAVRSAVDRLNVRRSADERIEIVVDNTFASPFCQRPLELGADVSCTSLTKAIGGFGTDIGGAVIGPGRLRDALLMYRKDFGGVLSPKAAWATLVYGLPSLAARMANYQKSAMRVARFLEEHPKVRRVRYPGLESFPQRELAHRQMLDEHGRFAPGSMLYFVLKDADERGESGARLIDWIAQNSYCITLAVSLGQVKTLIECPYSMTHAALPEEAKRQRGIEPGGIRLSVGLEDWHDLVADLQAALDAV
ncbi:MAG: PLP-dependent transferase [Phycisphaerae bacterium]|nr:PLP-dependent transferase [Phycisphaerae bacterium]MCZ2398658.1 PLP-dependent transferase [Phycisphaerae bacterium]NUQ50330.1 PLP-dependent transferase [Phycisphaerae bacterium]